MSEILIVYYSRTGKTRMVARKLAYLLGADIEEITEKKNRRGAWGFWGGVLNTIFRKPADLTAKPSVEGYSTVILAMPVWTNKPPPAMQKYIETTDLAGLKTAAFCTHDGGGGKGTFEKLAKMLPEGPFETLELKKPKPDDPELDAQLKDWADKCSTTG